MKQTQIDLYRAFVNAELDAGRPYPTGAQCAAAIGRTTRSTKHYGLGGRYTYEKQKIKAERGIATAADLQALADKDSRGTYTTPRGNGRMSLIHQVADEMSNWTEEQVQQAVVAELKEERVWDRLR